MTAQQLKELQFAAPGILSRIMNDIHRELPNFRSIERSKYFIKKITVEKPDRKGPHINLSLVYLQNYENFQEDLDERVISIIRESLNSMELSATVKDLVVNMIHYRNDKRES